MKLAVWIVVLLALVATGAWFWPPAGYGFVADLWLEEDEQEATPQFRTVSAFSLAECHANGLEGCLMLRSDGRQDVTVMVTDGLLQSHGELLTEGVNGGVLRYVAVMSEFHDDVETAFYCVYGRSEAGATPEYLANLETGARLLLTTRLWWLEDGTVMRSYDEAGAPACRIHYAGS